jgi:hypothetical protein
MTASKATKKAKKPHGRPAFEPTDAQRGEVVALAGAGYSEEVIADFLDIDPKTLRKHFGKLIRTATPKVVGKAYSTVAHQNLNDLAAAKYVLSTKGKDLGWTTRNEVTGKDGADLMAQLDLTKLGADRLQQLKDILALAGAAI